MEEQDQINKIAKNQGQILDEATKKAKEKKRIERKGVNQDYISYWLR
jgi:hypothetical protein